MNQEIKLLSKLLSIILVLFLIIDLPMIALINKNMYKKQFERINNEKTVSNPYLAAFVAYLCLVIGLYYFVIKDNLVAHVPAIGMNGAIFGFIVYGIYNATNKATIAEFGLKESFVDTLWGTILCAIISVLTIYVNKMI
jgi:uncharacterized membrane protein